VPQLRHQLRQLRSLLDHKADARAQRRILHQARTDFSKRPERGQAERRAAAPEQDAPARRALRALGGEPSQQAALTAARLRAHEAQAAGVALHEAREQRQLARPTDERPRWRAGRRRARLLYDHLRQEHVADALARADHRLTLAGVAERLARFIDSAAQRAVRDVHGWPQCVAHARHRDQLAGLAREQLDAREHLGLELELLSAAQEHALRGVEHVVTETQPHGIASAPGRREGPERLG
jgi:hypothetical protein